ncbi:MAG: hypothetical protein ACLS61_08915 [Ruminococcus sp.]
MKESVLLGMGRIRGVIVNNRVTEEIIKITFGDNWLIAAFVFVVAVSAIRFIRKNNLPKYFRKCLIVCVCAIAALIDSKFFSGMSILVRCG